MACTGSARIRVGAHTRGPQDLVWIAQIPSSRDHPTLDGGALRPAVQDFVGTAVGRGCTALAQVTDIGVASLAKAALARFHESLKSKRRCRAVWGSGSRWLGATAPLVLGGPHHRHESTAAAEEIWREPLWRP